MARRRQYGAYVILSLVVLALTAILLPSARPYFARYVGQVDPRLAVLASSLVGGVGLAFLQNRSGFEIVKGRATLRGIAISAGLATLFGAVIIVADFFLRYPENINVPPPQALLFYPVIGFVAEIVFHVTPLALLMLMLTPLRRRLGDARIGWIAIAIVAVTEPTFQVTFGGEPFSWAAAYTWLHIFAFALCQLAVFRRYDFFSMYAFRLVYYAYWHIIWGTLRLDILF